MCTLACMPKCSNWTLKTTWAAWGASPWPPKVHHVVWAPWQGLPCLFLAFSRPIFTENANNPYHNGTCRRLVAAGVTKRCSALEHIADFLSNALQSGGLFICSDGGPRGMWAPYMPGAPPSISTAADLARRHLHSAQARESAVRKLSLHRVK